MNCCVSLCVSPLSDSRVCPTSQPYDGWDRLQPPLVHESISQRFNPQIFSDKHLFIHRKTHAKLDI